MTPDKILDYNGKWRSGGMLNAMYTRWYDRTAYLNAMSVDYFNELLQSFSNAALRPPMYGDRQSDCTAAIDDTQYTKTLDF